MEYTKVPKYFVIEIIKKMTKIINLLPKTGGVYPV